MHRPISTTDLRRLAVASQRLSGHPPEASGETALDILRSIRCLQIDPIRAVERTQYLVLFSRLGPYDMQLLDQLAYTDKQLFEYWAHAASYVLIDDFPIHRHRMDNVRYGGGVRAQQYKAWVEKNTAYADYILEEIRTRGPLTVSDLKDRVEKPWESSVWSSTRNAAMMIASLHNRGRVMVSHRDGNKKHWDLAENVLPEWTPRGPLSAYEASALALEHALRALGAATEKQIKNHYTRDRYPEIKGVLANFLSEGRIIEVVIDGRDKSWERQGPWYMHADTIPLLDSIEAGDWSPRTVLLSPFDNLICDRDRTELLWDFFFRIEIYVPPKKREYGYYVLPILHGDRLIGRVDPKMDRDTGVLHIQNVYPEEGTPDDPPTINAVRGAILSLGTFLDARRIEFDRPAPEAWHGIEDL